METNIEKIIEEDLVNYSFNDKNGMITHNRYSHERISLVDILNAFNRNDFSTADKLMPFELQTISDKLIKLIDDNTTAKNEFKNAYNNAMIKDNKEAKTIIKTAYDKLKLIDQLYIEVFKLVDKMKK